MNTTSLHIKIEPALKAQAQKTAEDLGLSLSGVMKALLKQFIRTRQLSVGIPEIPNDYLTKSLAQAEEDMKAGRVTSFKTGQEALAYLDQEIKNEQDKHSSH